MWGPYNVVYRMEAKQWECSCREVFSGTRSGNSKVGPIRWKSVVRTMYLVGSVQWDSVMGMI